MWKRLFFKKSNIKSEFKANRKIRLGLALGGGGCRGIGHIGVIKALEELGIDAEFVAGTSVGSIVASLYAKGFSSKDMETFVKGLKKKDVFAGSIAFLKPAKTEKLEKILNELYGDILVFSDLKKKLKVVCTDIKTGEEVDFDHGNVAKVVSASCAVPGIFTPVVYDNMHLVDGGLRNNVPVDVVRKMGANVVFAVDVNHLRGTGTQSLSTVSVLSSTIGIMMQSKIDETMADADLIIKPSLENFSPMKLENIDSMIKIGYDTVMQNKDKILKMLSLQPKTIRRYFIKNGK